MTLRTALTKTLLPSLVIAGALVYSYTEQRPQSGVEVRAVAAGEPAAAYVRITKPELRDTLAGGNIRVGESVRYRLQPGAYMIRPGRQRRLHAKPIRVQVREGRFEPVVVRYRPVRRRGS
jgi:hypothetical protein